jgi:hypothetical protein
MTPGEGTSVPAPMASGDDLRVPPEGDSEAAVLQLLGGPPQEDLLKNGMA